ICDVGWATAEVSILLPLALDLDSLDAMQSTDLRTWFVAHVNITPPKIRRRPQTSSDIEQLSLL
ncbi:MAG: deoxyribodipyrimidine photo-lyase, partial [Leptolyngbya sp. SIO3F4]|nr:deoxyribodipyrimidine photo-lyase [Leptolyngbya sp. SIO3F4]